jgi:hypothetical protein
VNKMKQYYNAKPSKISNLGEDVHGAHRMYFDTYETPEERASKERSKQASKVYDAIKDQIKTLIKDTPDPVVISELLNKQFELKYGFSVLAHDHSIVVSEKREQALKSKAYKEFNSMLRAYKKLKEELREVSSPYYFSRWLYKARKKYSEKNTFIEQSGASETWKKYEGSDTNLASAKQYLIVHANAVQFGNSVTDKERAYILTELKRFISHWHTCPNVNSIDLSPISWSFGARGRAGSVAYYQPTTKVISVNRNRVGSLIHEIGHYIDYTKNKPSDAITYSTIKQYASSLPESMPRKEVQYYCKREEIFARSFEAYCIKHSLGFERFEQCGKAYLPELNDELIKIIESAIK